MKAWPAAEAARGVAKKPIHHSVALGFTTDLIRAAVAGQSLYFPERSQGWAEKRSDWSVVWHGAGRAQSMPRGDEQVVVFGNRLLVIVCYAFAASSARLAAIEMTNFILICGKIGP